MAVDTAVKRFSMINIGTAWPSALPPPDGTIAANDRAVLLNLYWMTLATTIVGMRLTVGNTKHLLVMATDTKHLFVEATDAKHLLIEVKT